MKRALESLGAVDISALDLRVQLRNAQFWVTSRITTSCLKMRGEIASSLMLLAKTFEVVRFRFALSFLGSSHSDHGQASQ